MNIEHLFARDEVLPSWWANAVGYFLSVVASGLRVTKQDDTHIQVVASAGNGAAVVPITGRWRWIEATINRAHPGGAAGTYDMFLTALDTVIASSPAPYTDDTNYAFALAIEPAGVTPPIVAGSVEIFRKIGSLEWDGAKITRIDQTVPATALHAHSHAAGQSDPIAPADINAASSADLAAETARAEAAETAEVARAEAAEAGLNTEITNETTRAEAAETANAAAITAETTRAQSKEPPVGAQILYTGSGDVPGGFWMVADGRLIDSTTYSAFDSTCGRTAPVGFRHTYNGGVDPGSNKVRLPDKRGRGLLGALDMGTGTAASDNSHVNAARGAKGGEAAHTSTTAEMPSHGHPLHDPGHGHTLHDPGHGHGVNDPQHYHDFAGYGVPSMYGGGWAAISVSGSSSGPIVPNNNNYPSGHATSIANDNWASTGISIQGAGTGIWLDGAFTGMYMDAAGGGAAHNNVGPYEADTVIVRVA